MCTRRLNAWTRRRAALRNRSRSPSMRPQNWSFAETTSSAAADGVGARRSATKSAMVTSVSWPTAENHRYRDSRDRPRHDLFVERPQILDRSAAAPDDDDVHPRHAPDLAQRARDFRRGVLALHAGRADDEVRVRIAPPEHLDDVADRGAVERRDNADLARQRRQRPLARRIEQPFVLQALLQLIEGQLPRAQPVRLQVLADELILAFGLVDRHPPARDDAQAVGRLELEVAQCGSENDRANLRGAVLEREIQVSRVPHAAVRQLALDPDLEELGFEQIAHSNRELGDGVDTAGRRRRGTGD